MELDIAEICKKGGRRINQDYVGKAVCRDRICLIACDGLGAYEDSGTASRISVETVLENFGDGDKPLTAEAIGGWLGTAHERIAAAKRRREIDGAACTTVACLFADGKGATIAHIGDTRVYFFTGGKLKYRTTDHSLAQLAVERGKIEPDELRFHKDQNKLTRVLGGKYFVLPDFKILDEPLLKGDAVLICTDGFWEYVADEEMEEDIGGAETAAAALHNMEERIAANADENNDNYSAVLAVVK